ncbi:uncharacterized protein LOC127717739 isoform X5 [Mytilus californianus]|uniref:uncharacterized protein LOC127717739 isoform X4 n=1 Tax=Mytilus californianus TaxID=6549 RepID=UPI002245774D|nr:uncharacterized protein LOC127717739 isoform X4 [Mytilus californianus]XP_052079482.1 uncharacterized protein LOC127717739 isoform X5 [Mytilus californianus]
MDTLNRAQTDQLIQKLTEMRESVLKKNDASSTEEIFLNESITNVETYLNILSDRDVIEYDKETLGIIQRLKQNLRFLSENRHAKSDFDFKMMVGRLTETLNTILQKRKKSDSTDPDAGKEVLDGENCPDTFRPTYTAEPFIQQMDKERRPDIIESTDIFQRRTEEICAEFPGSTQSGQQKSEGNCSEFSGSSDTGKQMTQGICAQIPGSTQSAQQKSEGNCSEFSGSSDTGKQMTQGICAQIPGSTYISQKRTKGKCTEIPGSTNIGQEVTDGKCSDIPRSTHISQQNTNGKRTEIAGAFYDIGCGIHLYSESDVSDIIQAIRWESDDFQRFYKEDTTLKHYKLETDFFNIKPKDPKYKENFPKDSSGMITVRVKLPNDINYQFLHLKAYIKFGQKWHMVETSLKEKSVTFQTAKIDALCIVSKPIKERIHITPLGCKYVAKTDKGIQIEFPPGAVEKDESIRLHVVPINKEILRRQYEERNKKGEAILAITDCLYTTGDTTLKKKVQVKLPLNDIRIPDESDEDYVYRLFRQNTNGQFTLTDNVVTVDENHNAVFETDKISGTSVSLIGKEELKKGPLEISGTIEEMHGHKSICKILFFVSDVTSRGLTVLLACIEKSKMQAFCHSCEDRGFHLFKNWISKDLVFKPQIKIDITLKGCFTLPRFTSRKRLDLTFLPNSAENFTRFVVEIKHKIDQDVYGILLLTKDQEIVDEISYNTLSTKEYTNASLLKGRNTPDRRARTARPDQMTSTKGASYINRQPTLSVRKCSEDDFLTEKGMMAIGKLLNADKLFETVLHLDMKQVQYDQICEKVPSSNRQAFTLLKTALDQLKNNKVDKLSSALESVGEGGLAESIRQFFKYRRDLSQIQM